MPTPDSQELFAFERPSTMAERPRWLAGLERGALTGMVAVALGPLPMYALYLWRYWRSLPLETWQVLVAQVGTFMVLVGAAWGASVGLAFGLVEPPRPRPTAVALHGALGTLAGAAACIPAGIVAAGHFGRMSTPYFGGAELLLATLGTVMVAGIRFARARNGSGHPVRLLLHAMAPLPLVALPLVALVPLGLGSLDLDSMRALAAELGLETLGALLGGVLGGVGGGWVGLSTALST